MGTQLLLVSVLFGVIAIAHAGPGFGWFNAYMAIGSKGIQDFLQESILWGTKTRITLLSGVEVKPNKRLYVAISKNLNSPTIFFAAILFKEEIVSKGVTIQVPDKLTRLGGLTTYPESTENDEGLRARDFATTEAELYWNWNPYAFQETWINFDDEGNPTVNALAYIDSKPWILSGLKLKRVWLIEGLQKTVGVYHEPGNDTHIRFTAFSMQKRVHPTCLEVKMSGEWHDEQANLEDELAKYLMQVDAFLIDTWLDEGTFMKRYDSDTWEKVTDLRTLVCSKVGRSKESMNFGLLGLKSAKFNGSKILAIFGYSPPARILVAAVRCPVTGKMQITHISMHENEKAADAAVKNYYVLAFNDAFSTEPWIRHFELNGNDHPWSNINLKNLANKIASCSPFSMSDSKDIFLQAVRIGTPSENGPVNEDFSTAVCSYLGKIFLVVFHIDKSVTHVGTPGTVDEVKKEYSDILKTFDHKKHVHINSMANTAEVPYDSFRLKLFRDICERSVDVKAAWSGIGMLGQKGKEPTNEDLRTLDEAWIDKSKSGYVPSPRNCLNKKVKVRWYCIYCKVPVKQGFSISSFGGKKTAQAPQFQTFYAIVSFEDGIYKETISVTEEDFRTTTPEETATNLKLYLRGVHDRVLYNSLLLPTSSQVVTSNAATANVALPGVKKPIASLRDKSTKERQQRATANILPTLSKHVTIKVN